MTTLRTAAQQALEALEYDGLLKKRQAITALRAALAQQAEPVEPVAWSGYNLDGMVEAFSRVIEAHHSSKHPFHSPIDMDARMALRILRGFIPAMKAYAAPPQQAEPVEPVAWRTFDGEGGYDYRTYADNENYAAEWAQRNPRHVGWVKPLYTAPPRCPNCASLEAQNTELDRKLAELEQAEPVAVVGTQVDVWRGCDGRWAPPGGPIKTALMLKDMPVGTMLYTAPPQRKPLTERHLKEGV